jgi:hypothetical protein
LWEYEVLTRKELINRSAYFELIGGVESVHHKLCDLQNLEEVHKKSSFRTKAFFLNGKYSTGYATHGIFPYRGKFHPQLIRALLNILEIKPGHIVLDPMSGSSTVAVEAALLGIDSICVDISPFCELIGKVKTCALNLDIKLLENIAAEPKKLLGKLKKDKVPDYFISPNNDEKKPYYEILLLAFLDAVGFSVRSDNSIDNLFARVLERYVLTIKHFQTARETIGLKIGRSKILQGNALSLPIEDNIADIVITSPPYSFAIDYLKNDKPQLEYLGADLAFLKQEMIGLQGKGIENKIQNYFDKMRLVICELSRVSKNNAPIIIIAGSNDIQTKGIRLETEIIEIAKTFGLKFNLNLTKPILGIQNTMKEEAILFFTNQK